MEEVAFYLTGWALNPRCETDMVEKNKQKMLLVMTIVCGPPKLNLIQHNLIHSCLIFLIRENLNSFYFIKFYFH